MKNLHLVFFLLCSLSGITQIPNAGILTAKDTIRRVYPDTNYTAPPLIIENQRIINLNAAINDNGSGIFLQNCKNVIIRNCIIGPTANVGISLYKCYNVTIINCKFFDNSAGIFALECHGVRVLNNQFSEVTVGITSNTDSRGQFVQFNKVTSNLNYQSSKINFNIGENSLGMSNAEDLINLFKSSGVEVMGNRLRGGGYSGSGGGILLGDGDNNINDTFNINNPTYNIARNNVLVNPGQYGIGPFTGRYISILDNKVYSKQLPNSNVGIKVQRGYSNFNCNNITVTGNYVYNINDVGTPNNYYDAHGVYDTITGIPKFCTNIIVKNNSFDTTATSSFSPTDALSYFNENMLSQELLKSDLIAYYKFDSTLVDNSGNNLRGVFKPTGSPTYPVVRKYRGLQLNASTTTQYIEVADSNKILSSLTNRITVSAWIKPSSFSGTIRGIIKSPNSDGYWKGWRLEMNNNQLGANISTIKRRTEVFNDTIHIRQYLKGGTINNTANWYHVALTYDGSRMKLFVNGLIVADTPLVGRIRYDSIVAPLHIGASNGTDNFRGIIENAAIYRGSFTNAEILDLYNRERVDLNYENIAFYRFDKDFKDYSGNMLHLTDTLTSFSYNGQTNVLNFSNNSQCKVLSSSILKLNTLTDQLVVSLWLKPNSPLSGTKTIIKTPNYTGITSSPKGWSLELSGSAIKMKVSTSNTTLDSLNSSTLTANKWHHVVAIYRGDSMLLYINNQKTKKIRTGTIAYPTSGTWNFGANLNSINGFMDNVNFYRGTMSDTEVTNLYNDEKGKYSGLVAFYKFNFDLLDTTINNLHGYNSVNSGVNYALDNSNIAAQFSNSIIPTAGKNYISVAQDANLTSISNKITVMAWIKPSILTSAGIDSIQGIIQAPKSNGWDTGWRMNIDNGRLGIRLVKGTGATSADKKYLLVGGVNTIQVGNWYQVAFTYDSTIIRGYIFNSSGGIVAKDSFSISGNIFYNTSSIDSLLIGVCGGTLGYQGLMDDVRIYNDVLLQADISALNRGSNAPVIRSAEPEEKPIKSDLAVTIYPNPATNVLIVQKNNSDDVISEIRIVNTTGATLFYKAGLTQGNSATIEVPLEMLSNGMYILQVVSSKGYRISKKFIKLK
jgi:parallel beta-helix repeat protein